MRLSRKLLRELCRAGFGELTFAEAIALRAVLPLLVVAKWGQA